MRWQLAEINIARLRAPLDDPQLTDFTGNLDRINALAETSDGFVWRLQTEDGNATAMRPYEDEMVIINVTVWSSVASLGDYVYRSGHVEFLRRKREWFHRFGEAAVALWWLPAGERPTLTEAIDRLDHLRAYGPSNRAFTFARPWPVPRAEVEPGLGARASRPSRLARVPVDPPLSLLVAATEHLPHRASARHPQPSAPTPAARQRRR